MPLFQSSVLKKYIKQQDQAALEKAYQKFTKYFHNTTIQENIKEAKEEQFQEGFLRELFVNILGYTLNPNPNYNLTTEYKNVKDSKKTDGAIIIESKVKAVIELKGTNIADLAKIESQAFGYKNNQPDCTYVVTSNFEKVRFYIDNAIEHLEFNLFTLTLEEFQLLYLCLAFQNIQKDLPKKVKESSLQEEEAITKKFYQDYSLFKREMYRDLVKLNMKNEVFRAELTKEDAAQANKNIKLTLFKKSQKLIDRFLFIFFAEDRDLLPPNSALQLLEQWDKLKELDAIQPLYDRFKLYFGFLDQGREGTDKKEEIFAYNGGLFKPDAVLDSLIISDELLYTHTKKLSKYDFESQVDVNILGHIFENSLNEIESINAEIEGTDFDKQKTKRKKDGVFYTPKYITKYIVDNTVGKLCEEKKAELAIDEAEYQKSRKGRTTKKLKELQDKLEAYRAWLLQITICDPACGSGAFLNQALNFLIEEHQYIDELNSSLLGISLVFPDIENTILENNIYGVDINEESVEIAKLSLWLRTAQPKRKLNDLSNNIKCGNSLIDDPKVAGSKAFNWQQEFPHVFERGGFDVVIGNPPYVVVKLEDKFNSIYNSIYVVSKGGKNNLYKLFFEKAIDLLKHKNGLLGFITPSNYLTSKDSFELRKLLLLNTTIYNIITYTEAEKVFENVTQAVATIILKKIESKEYLICYKSSEYEDKISKAKILANKNLSIKAENKLIKKLNLLKYRFDDFVEGFQGEINVSTKKEYFSLEKESDNFLSLLRGNHIGRYVLKESPIEFCPTSASKRSHYDLERIVFQEVSNASISRRVNAIITNNVLCGHTTNYMYSKNKNIENLTLLGVVNSSLINYYFKFYNMTNHVPIGEIKNIPLPLSIETFIVKDDVKNLVNNYNNLKKVELLFSSHIISKFNLEKLSVKLQNWHELEFAAFLKELEKARKAAAKENNIEYIKLTLSEEAEWMQYFNEQKQKAQALKAEIDKTDKAIDQMVYELYGLTEEEIKIVEESTK